MSQNIHIPRRWKYEWETDNPVIREGQPVLEIDSNRLKVGDGRLHWNDLPFVSASGGGGGGSLPESGIIDGGEP